MLEDLEKLNAKLLVDDVKKILNGTQRAILELAIQGYNKKEISTKLKVSYVEIRKCLSYVKEVISKWKGV